MTETLPYLGGLALLALGAHRWAALRGGRPEPALRQAHRFAFCLGAALLVLAPATARAIEHTVALPGLPMLLGDLLRTLAAGCLGLLAGRSVKRSAPATGLTLLALTTLFAATPLHHATGELSVDTRHRPLLACYDLLLILYPAGQLTALRRTLRDRTRRARPGVHRLGLRLLGAATVAGLVWTAWGVDDVRLALTTGRQSDGDDALSTALGLLCAALAVAGGSAAVWPRLRRWCWSCRTYRALTPLWSALHQAFPQIALPQLHPRGVHFALYRRVIEIHDGLLLLRPRLAACDRSGPDTAAATAARIAAALSAPPATAGSPPGRVALAATMGTAAAASQLEEISRAFARLHH
ncbi:MAB_1171c family putative transporter [Streptomyces orinoci]|uniref:MAB_1171c family putative transporter n=1 Tax=Streptomyces orinoci TaxID=67339 RepID=A0ABV3JRC3_STRON|nr:MAB_1171c family putative transporter [Streptomyces orinoci]